MIVPNAALAYAEQTKIVDYLLNPEHPDNGGKAAFFHRLGFTRERWQEMAQVLCELVAANSVNDIIPTVHGTKYIVEGTLFGPAESGWVRTVWIIDAGMERPRLVTAYPQ